MKYSIFIIFYEIFLNYSQAQVIPTIDKILSEFPDLKQCKNSSKNVTVSMETFSNQIMSPDFAINFDVYLVGDHDAVITLVEKSDDIVSGQHYDIVIGAENNTKIIVKDQKSVVGDESAEDILLYDQPRLFKIQLRQGGYLTIKYHDIKFPRETEGFILHEIRVNFIRFSSPGHVNFFFDCPDSITNLVDWTSNKISDHILDKNNVSSASEASRITNILYFIILFVTKQIATIF